MKHTHGPWLINQYDTLEMNGHLVCHIADLCPDDADYNEADANARLIAAAPELLAALDLLERSIGGEILTAVDGTEFPTPTHQIDYYRNYAREIIRKVTAHGKH